MLAAKLKFFEDGPYAARQSSTYHLKNGGKLELAQQTAAQPVDDILDMTREGMRFPWMRSNGFPIEPKSGMIRRELAMSSQVVTPNTEAAILARMLEPDERELTPDAARYLLSIKLPAGDEDRVDELSAKARAGSLTAAEAQELDGYLHIGSLVAILQSTARRILKQAPARRQ